MNCNEVRELLPAYVIGALEADETSELEAHLRSGREHDDELVDLRATVFALDRFADESSLDEPESARPNELRPIPLRSGARRIRAISSRPQFRYALAAAAAIAIFASGWLIATRMSGGTQQNVSLALQNPAGQTLSLTGNSSDARVAVTMTGFERLPADKTYQLWAIRGGTWVPIGLCNPTADAHWSGEFPFAVKPGERIAVTVEPAGGSQSPSSAPLLVSAT